ARRAKASRSIAAINRSASRSFRQSARENIRADHFDREEYGRTNRLPCVARRESQRIDLSRLPALRNGRPFKVARSSVARSAHVNSFCPGHTRPALSAGFARSRSIKDDRAKFYSRGSRRRSFPPRPQKRSSRRDAGRCRSKNSRCDCNVRERSQQAKTTVRDFSTSLEMTISS